MSVFDDIDRTDLRAADHRIAAFDYLNESARPSAGRVRTLIDDCLARYPKEHAEQLSRRLRSVDNIQHKSAFFELLLHELLVRAGCTIVAIEPEIPGINRSPDFLVQTADGSRFYLEATLATGRSQADAASQSRMEDALAAFDAVESPDFFLSVYTGAPPQQPLALRRLRERVEEWLAGLDYDAVAAAWDARDDLPELVHEEHGCSIRVEPVPRGRSRGDPGQRAIGAINLDTAGFVHGHAAIRSAVEGKASRYGDPDLPYVVAVNALADFSGETHAIEALFGTEAIEVRCVDGEFECQDVRNADGAWNSRQGPRNRRVSAVLSTERVTPWGPRDRRARLIFNPWARRPLETMPLAVDKRWAEGNRLRRLVGSRIDDLLGLTPDWPGPD